MKMHTSETDNKGKRPLWRPRQS